MDNERHAIVAVGPVAGYDPRTTIADTIQQWLDRHREKMGEANVDPDQHLYTFDPMPSRGQLEEWVKLLRGPDFSAAELRPKVEPVSFRVFHALPSLREPEGSMGRIFGKIGSIPEHPMVRLPRALTAENGAKALLIGEFHETCTMSCPECDGDEECLADCSTCHGQGYINQRVPVEWDTIKNIYAKIVEKLAR